MVKNILAAIFLLFYFGPVLADETLTITTYYPSPFGSYNELQSNKMAIGDTNSVVPNFDPSDMPPEEGQLWIARDIILKSQSSLPNKDSPNRKAGELAVSNNQLYLYDDSISNWVKQGGGVSYTYYCFSSTNYGTPVCPVTVTIGTQGPCDIGFTVRKALGSWGGCLSFQPSNMATGSWFLPPVPGGSSCGPGIDGGGSNSRVVGQAYVCSQ